MDISKMILNRVDLIVQCSCTSGKGLAWCVLLWGALPGRAVLQAVSSSFLANLAFGLVWFGLIYWPSVLNSFWGGRLRGTAAILFPLVLLSAELLGFRERSYCVNKQGIAGCVLLSPPVENWPKGSWYCQHRTMVKSNPRHWCQKGSEYYKY